MSQTRYPIFLVHGTGFRDKKHLNYWGRIPKALNDWGAEIAYGHQAAWGTVADNAVILGRNITRHISETGCGKVNIIAHSKGGVEARYLASTLDCGHLIASITTVATPHHGSKTMDAIQKLPSWIMRVIALPVNGVAKLIGDKKPDFFTVCAQFTTEHMKKFNDSNPDVEGIYYQSYASAMKSSFSDVIMLFQNVVVRLIEGENDGMVTITSARWTNFKDIWRGSSRRGISHVDTVDIRRRRLTKKVAQEGVVDICDCYIAIAEELKRMGF